MLSRASHQLATILSPLSLPPSRRSKLSPSATRHPCPGLSLSYRVNHSLCSLIVTSQVQISTGYNSYTTASHSDTAIHVLATALSQGIACPIPIVVNKGLRYATKESLARACQRPPPLGRNYGSWHGHCPQDIFIHRRTAVSTLRGGGTKTPHSRYLSSQPTGRALYPPPLDKLC
jgi:hypothetical protein